MTDCLVVQPIARCGIELLERAGLRVFEAKTPDLETLRPHLKSARAAITRNQGLSAQAIELAPHLTIIASHGTGTDKIDKAAAEKRGIRVLNTPGANAQSVAEHALALILACARKLPIADRALRENDWSFRERTHPIELSGRRLGLVGYGHVARKLGQLAKGLGMGVLVLSDHTSDEDLAQSGMQRVDSLDELLSGVDVVSLHKLASGKPLIGSDSLASMRPGAILINTARGALIDEAALVNALRNGALFAAGLDVFASEPLPPDSPLRDCPNLILTPHMAGSGVDALNQTAREVARKVIEGLGLPQPD